MQVLKLQEENDKLTAAILTAASDRTEQAATFEQRLERERSEAAAAAAECERRQTIIDTLRAAADEKDRKNADLEATVAGACVSCLQLLLSFYLLLVRRPL